MIKDKISLIKDKNRISKVFKIPTQNERIKEILIVYKGKAKAIKSKDIAKAIGIEEGPSSVTIRNLITETIHKYQLPVAGNPAKGYFLMESQKELDEYIKTLNSRILQITDRLVRITLYFARFNKDPTKLTPETLEIDEDEDEEDEDEDKDEDMKI